jgi:hypothetical protein
VPRSLQERRCGDGTANLLTDFLYSFWCSGTIELRSRTREEGKILHKLKYHQYTLHDTDPTLAATAGAAASSAAQAPTGIGAASEIKPYRQEIERGWKLFHIVGLTTSQTYDGRALSYEVASPETPVRQMQQSSAAYVACFQLPGSSVGNQEVSTVATTDSDGTDSFAT